MIRRFTRRPGALVSLVPFVVSLLLGTQVRSQAEDGLVVEGLRGSIPREAVARVVDARTADLIACVTQRRGTNEMLAGSVTLSFVIGTNGATRVARVVSSSVGDRTAERCMTTIGASLRFPPPTGGEAEAAQTIQFPIDPEVRPPIAMSTQSLASTRVTLGRLATRCRVTGGTVHVTAYVGRGGHVMNAGAHASTSTLDPKLDCVVTAILGMDFPDPGSYPAKTDFDVGTPP